MAYRTKQRDIIMNFFLEHEDECFTARQVCDMLDVGSATVFRTLSLLTEEGKLRRFEASKNDGAVYQYDPNGVCGRHMHLKCSKCGKLVHLNCDEVQRMMEHIREEHSFLIDCGATVIYGICAECASEREA